MYHSDSRLEPDSLSQLPPNESTIVQVLWTATETVLPSIINPSTNIWLDAKGTELCLLKFLNNLDAGICSGNIVSKVGYHDWQSIYHN